MTVRGTGEERAGLCVFFLGIMLVSGTGGGARVIAIGSTWCGRAPEVATAGERLVGLNDSGETTVPESGSDCPVASFVDDSITLGSSARHIACSGAGKREVGREIWNM